MPLALGLRRPELRPLIILLSAAVVVGADLDRQTPVTTAVVAAALVVLELARHWPLLLVLITPLLLAQAVLVPQATLAVQTATIRYFQQLPRQAAARVARKELRPVPVLLVALAVALGLAAQVAQEIRLALARPKAVMAEAHLELNRPEAVAVVAHLLLALTLHQALAVRVAQEQRQQYPAQVLLTLAAVVAVATLTAVLLFPERLAARVAVALAAVTLLVRAAQPTQVAAGAGQVLYLARLQAAQAAPASSSFPTLWRPALRSSLSPQQRGLHRPAQRRWITLS